MSKLINTTIEQKATALTALAKALEAVPAHHPSAAKVIAAIGGLADSIIPEGVTIDVKVNVSEPVDVGYTQSVLTDSDYTRLNSIMRTLRGIDNRLHQELYSILDKSLIIKTKDNG